MAFKYITYVLLLLNTSILSVFAQELKDSEMVIESMIGEVMEEANEEFDYSELSERLEFYLRNPIDINKANQEELAELNFLSVIQIQELLRHREQGGEFLSLYELQVIKGFNDQDIQRLLPFISLKSKDFQSDLKWNGGDHNLIFRYGRILEKQKGYLPPERKRQSHYQGTPDRLFIRYRYHLENKFQISLNMKKDAGEEFFEGSQKSGFDFYSASLSIKNIGKMQNLVIGDYSLQLGQGLSLWNGFSFGKGSLIQHVARQNIGLKPYTSANEALYLRGAAGAMRIKQLDIMPFVSYKKLDGTLSADSLSFSSIGISGYHRTPSEIKNRRTVSELLYGLNLTYSSENFKVGALVYHTAFDKPMLPNQQLYNKYVFRGNSLTNGSIYYHYTFRNIYTYGETAYSFDRGLGTVNGLIISLSHQLSLVLLHRHYNKYFHSLKGEGFSENSKTINEKGLYSGLILNIKPSLEWVGYADYFKFPWIKYGVDGPSSGYDLFSQLAYSPKKSLNITLRYRYRNKEENALLDGTINRLENIIRQQARLEIKYGISGAIEFRNRFEFLNYSKIEVAKEKGYMVYHDVIFKPLKGSLSGNIRVAAFKTDGYDSRIYAYENDVLYGYSFPPYYNTGLRLYANVRCRIRRNLDLWARYASFVYEENGVGSGLDQIQGNVKSDIRLQLRILF